MKKKRLRAEIQGAVMYSYTLRSNVTIEEMKAVKELRLDKTHVILAADKGVTIL